jgi:RHS repeat-associated protein
VRIEYEDAGTTIVEALLSQIPLCSQIKILAVAGKQCYYGHWKRFQRRDLMRGFAFFLCLVLAYGTAAPGMNVTATSIAELIRKLTYQRPGPYTDRPTKPYLGKHPGRAPRTRGGLWSEQNLKDMANSRRGKLYAGTEAESQSPNHTLSVEAGPGNPLPWEGSAPGIGGNINSANGNRLTSLNLFKWRARGGMVVDFTLYHNSETSYNDELGHGWSWSYDVYINESGNTATVHWGNGLSVPFTAQGGGTTGLSTGGDVGSDSNSVASWSPGHGPAEEHALTTTYNPPTGIHDSLIKNNDGSWTYTTKHQIVYNFNDDGFCTSITDRNGNQITFTLNGQNYVTEVTGPDGRSYEITLDGSNNFESVEDPSGRIWEFTRSSDNLITVTWPDLDEVSYTDQFTYTANHDIATHTDRRGKVWSATYNSDGSIASAENPLEDEWTYVYLSGYSQATSPLSTTVRHNYSSGKLVSVVDEASYTESYEYDGDYNVSQITDKRAKEWDFTYDGDGNLLTKTDPLEHTWTYTWSAANDLLTIEDPLENVTEVEYDVDGNLLTVTDPLLRVVLTRTYDTYGRVLTSEDGEENETSYDYNSNGYPTTITNPLAKEWTLTWDTMGRLTSATDPNSNTESVTYDEWGRAVTYTHEDTTTLSLAYNLLGQVTSLTDERGKVTSYEYNDAAWLSEVTNAENESLTYTCNGRGWRTAITNGRNKTREYTYTARGEVYTLTLPDETLQSWSYNGTGDVTAYTNGMDQTIGYSFDDAGRNIGIDYPTGTDTSLSFDNANRCTSMVDATGTTSITFNDASEITVLDTPQGDVEYTYDAAGRRATMEQVGVGTTTYTYDAASHLTALQNAFAEDTSWLYDDAGRVTKQTFDTGAYTNVDYDVRDRVTAITHKNSSNATLSSEVYDYDNVGNLVEKTVNSVTTEYSYDDVDRLLTEARSGYSAVYAYDANGNRATKTLNSVTDTYSYDDADKLTTIVRGGNTIKSFEYDDVGRTVEITAGANVTEFDYDYEDRITQITYPSTATNTFAYNGLGTRASKVDSGGTKAYLRDGIKVTAPVLSDGSATYTPRVSERRSSTTKFIHNNYIGSTERLTNTSQATTDTRQYDAFGIQVASTGSTPTPFGFGGLQGYQQDSESGLHLVGHRYYDPSLGRFLTSDPARDGHNWYSYCGNNPTSYVDPGGLYIKKVEVNPGEEFLAVGFAVALMRIGATKRGNHLVDELINGKIGYTIRIRPKGIGSYYDPEDKVLCITMDEVHNWDYLGKDGKYHEFSLMRVIAHELGHIDFNYDSHPGTDEQLNVDNNENPIMTELGENADRGKYKGGSRKKKKLDLVPE